MYTLREHFSLEIPNLESFTHEETNSASYLIVIKTKRKFYKTEQITKCIPTRAFLIYEVTAVSVNGSK